MLLTVRAGLHVTCLAQGWPGGGGARWNWESGEVSWYEGVTLSFPTSSTFRQTHASVAGGGRGWGVSATVDRHTAAPFKRGRVVLAVSFVASPTPGVRGGPRVQGW